VELKRLELFGFKSFADRTCFAFDSGVTAIVGPNGCGKSNIVDAVKWVLGEQSAKSLRGREMADVIFAGSESRRSLGFAEATLTFDNARGVLPIDLPEVEVSRRLYRSGESEYLLNRKPCRLRDVRELFMDTGVGVDAYSLIEQGKVDVLLQSNPQERRLIFEEAAGISRYKAKRREAERKLARTEQNLLRLHDIVQEVQRRLRSVKVQAGRARSWKQYHARLQDLRVSYALNTYHEHTLAMADQQADLDGLQDRRSAAAGRLADLDRRRAALEAEAMDLETQARQADAVLSQVRAGIATAENEMGFHRTRADELRQVAQRDRRKLGHLSAHLRDAETGAEARRREIHRIDEAAGRQEATVADIEDRLRAVSDRVRDLTERIETAKAEMLDLAQARTQAASRRAGLSSTSTPRSRNSPPAALESTGPFRTSPDASARSTRNRRPSSPASPNAADASRPNATRPRPSRPTWRPSAANSPAPRNTPRPWRAAGASWRTSGAAARGFRRPSDR